jgi:protein-L-isoaspartate(D-aspartate) O-methyltransferase
MAFALPNATVVGIDVIPGLVSQSIANMKKAPATAALLASGRVSLLDGDGWAGYAPGAPYDLIHVGAAAETLPDALVEQLCVRPAAAPHRRARAQPSPTRRPRRAPRSAPGGRIICPVGVYSQNLIQADKKLDGTVSTTELMGVVYVPLVRTVAG